MADTRAMGKPVALEARAEERRVRGLISMTIMRSVNRVMGELYVGAADNLNRFHNFIGLFLKTLLRSSEMVSMGAEQKESPVCTPNGSIFSIKQTVIILSFCHGPLPAPVPPSPEWIPLQNLAYQAGL